MATKLESAKILTVAQAASEMQVSVDTILKWARLGHFKTFVPPGQSLGGGKSGPKMLRIERTDWESFIQSSKVEGMKWPAAEIASAVPSGIPCGSDGVKRLVRKAH